MSVTSIIWLAVLALLLFTVWFFYAKIRLFITRNFGSAKNLRAMIEEGEDDTRPRSVPGATDLVLPRIRADFPEFHWPEFRAEAEQLVKNWLRERGCTDILIHRTVIRDYTKEHGNCYTVLYSSVQYMKEGIRHQSRCSVTMGYVQDPDKAGYDNGVGLLCPGCGAPNAVSFQGTACRYCGSPLHI